MLQPRRLLLLMVFALLFLLPTCALATYNAAEMIALERILDDFGISYTAGDPTSYPSNVSFDSSNPQNIRVCSLILNGASSASRSLTLEGFTKLQTLRCESYAPENSDPSSEGEGTRDIGLTSLTLVDLPALRELHCGDNQLSVLNLLGVPGLVELYCAFNQLTQLELSPVPELSTLICRGNRLSILELAQVLQLKELNCSDNKLLHLDLTPVPELAWVQCANNQMAQLDLAGLTKLVHLFCPDNQLTNLDLSSLSQLNGLFCWNNRLDSLNLSGVPRLHDLSCGGNQLTHLDLSSVPELEWLDIIQNQLTSIDLSATPGVQELACYGNRITSFTNPEGMTIQVSSTPGGVAYIAYFIGVIGLREPSEYRNVYLTAHPDNGSDFVAWEVGGGTDSVVMEQASVVDEYDNVIPMQNGIKISIQEGTVLRAVFQ